MRSAHRVAQCVSLFLCVTAVSAFAASRGNDGVTIDGPAAPDAPAVVARDDKGRATIRATRIHEALVVDGLLDEPIYQRVPAIGDFIQQEPVNGAAATEKTDVWLFYDDKSIYVSARCWDTHPEREIANEMRRDGQNLINNENFGVIFDTFYDRRNGFLFHVSAAGGMFDGYITDERDNNRDWNTVWTAKTRRDGKGWVVEMAIPFKSLRYGGGETQIWGINFRRVVRWKNEFSYLTLVPASYGMRGLIRLSSAGTVVGLEAPRGIKNLEVKPYAIGGLTTDRSAEPVRSNDVDRDAGFDVKYGVTKSLTADFSYNTDFAQVEDDEQQVNLTRFSQYFPEKREFFLEGQGIFSFGGVQSGNNPGGGNNGDTPVLFFSRRIGLTDDVSVPIRTGGRITGRAGKYMIGALNIQTDDAPSGAAPATNFSVVRVRRDILRRSNIGIIATQRAPSAGASNTVFGTDANFAFGESTINAYYAETRTPGRVGRDASWLGRYELAADRYGVRAEHVTVQENFNPEIGFLRRTDFRRSFAQARFSPRPAHSRLVRKYQLEATLDYVTNNAGRLDTRQQGLEFQTHFNSSDQFTVEYSRQFEYLAEPFEITDTVAIPSGGYRYQDVRASYNFGPQRKVSGWLNYKQGSFYDGTRREASYHNGRVELSTRLSIEPRITQVWVQLPYGDFTTTLLGTRAAYTLSPRMAIGSLLQLNTKDSRFSTNLRFRWEYAPGSDLFVVFDEGRDTYGPGYPHLQSRTFVVKMTRLFRF